MVTCKHFDKLLDDYLAGRLGKVRSFVFRMHMALCPPCKRYLDDYRKVVDAARDQCKHETSSSPMSSDIAEAISRAMVGDSSPDSKP